MIRGGKSIFLSILSGFNFFIMLTDHFNETWKELKAATREEGHPFRVCSLASFETQDYIKQRIVNLREVTSEDTLLFYTDSRSSKIEQINKNPNASVLFYDYRISLQVMLRGIIKVHTNDDLWQDHRLKIEGRSINDYNTKYPPGKKINNPLDVMRTEEINFAVLELIPESIEYLKLRDEPNRVRAIFTKENEDWNKTFIIP